MKTKIYTKTGDQGQTSLVGGTRVEKNHLRIMAYGTVDELNSSLGICLSHMAGKDFGSRKDFLEETLLHCQHQLFVVGSLLACEKESFLEKMPQLNKDTLQILEKNMDHMLDQLPELKEFILPGGGLAGAHLHSARTICRRSERAVIELFSSQNMDIPGLVPFLNRLGDYLFVAARFANHLENKTETTWKKH